MPVWKHLTPTYFKNSWTIWDCGLLSRGGSLKVSIEEDAYFWFQPKVSAS